MKQLKSVCVFCGSRSGINPIYKEQTYALGKLFAQNNIRLVYGGGNIGLMGTIARGALENKGKITGIIPKFLIKKEMLEDNLKQIDEVIITQNMHERKMLMYEKADAFVALSGGIGTLEELVEQLTWAQLGQHQKPILLADFDHFWQPFFKLLDHMDEQSFIYNTPDVGLLRAERAEDVIPKLIKSLPSTSSPAHLDE